MKVWIKDGYFWRDLNYGKASFGDLIFNTCNKIVEENDMSEWAYYAMLDCYDLIQERKRWPDRMSDETCVKTWFARIVNRTYNKLRYLVYKLSGKYYGKRKPYKYQKRMTRDIYTAFGPVAITNYSHDLLGNITPVWYCYTPYFWAWFNYMKTSDNKYLKRYRFWRKMWFKPKKDYVIRLGEIREKGIELIQNMKS